MSEKQQKPPLESPAIRSKKDNKIADKFEAASRMAKVVTRKGTARKTAGTAPVRKKHASARKAIRPQHAFEQRSERDEETLIVSVLQQRGFRVRQDLPVGDGFADIYGVRDDVQIVIEMKRRDKFHTRGLRELARAQARRYAKVLKPLYIGISDGQTLHLYFRGRRCTHQVTSGVLLQQTNSASCPLDLGADYGVFREFPHRQREQYKYTDSSIVARTPLFDIRTLLNDQTADVAFIAGEPGSGKTTYAWQLAESKSWDPLWLDASLLSNDPVHTLDEARQRLTGYTGDLSSFLITLRAYRQRMSELPTGIVVDGLDEWPNVHQTLPALLRFAKTVKLKVLVLGRTRTIDSLIDTESTLKAYSTLRYDLPMFDDNEWKRAEARYIKTHRLKSRFEGRAREMSLLPEMMALIADAYEGEQVDPAVTEEDVYRRYRRKKCAAVAKSGVPPEAAQDAIDVVANAMLVHDSVNLRYRFARDATVLVDALLEEGALRAEGDDRNRHVRFRFGRVRDDALRKVPIRDLFDKPIVGRSALTYIALRDEAKRGEYIRLSLNESDIEAVSLVREHDWWLDLAKIPPALVKKPYVILAYAREKLREYPDLLFLAGAEPEAMHIASIHRADAPLPIWRTWLAAASNEQQLHDITGLTLTMLKGGGLPLADAVEATDLIRGKLFRNKRDVNEGHDFWHLVDEICQRLPVRSARRFLNRTIPEPPIVGSGVGPILMYYHGINYHQDMIKAVQGVRDRSTPRAFEAWASALLQHAMTQEWPGFDGEEMSGSDGDNAWLIQAILPSMKAIVGDDEARSIRLLKGYRISRGHPAFRLRAYIRAAPISALDAIPRTMLNWRKSRSGGIPSLASTLDSRQDESPIIREQGLNDALTRFGHPLNHSQVKTFHQKLARGNALATRQAFSYVSRPDFPSRDMFQVDFFQDLDWANRRPIVATKLLLAALGSNYPPLHLMLARGYSDIMSLAFTNARVRKLLSAIPGIADAMTDVFHSQPPDVRAASASVLYDEATLRGKRTILRWCHELPCDLAIEILRRGLNDDALIPEEPSGDEDVNLKGGSSLQSFHEDAWYALVMCWHHLTKTLFHRLNVDILALARRSKAPAAVCVTIQPILEYGVEYSDDRSVCNEIVEHYFAIAESAGPKLRGLIAKHLVPFYGLMTDEQRGRYLAAFRDTKQVAIDSVQLARRVPSKASVDRARWHARENVHRSAIAWMLWQDMHAGQRALTPFEEDIVSALLENPNEETLQNLAHLAIEMSKWNPSAGTALLLRVSMRAVETGALIHAVYDMRFDWSTVSVAELKSAVIGIMRADKVVSTNIEVVAAGLSSKVDSAETADISAAFELLIQKYDYVREDYRRWRSLLSSD